MRSIYSKLLKRFLDWTDSEILAKKRYIKWEEMNIKWDEVDLTWDELSILLEVDSILRGGGDSDYRRGNPWAKLKKDIGEEKTQKIIKLYCRVNNIETENYSVKNKDIKISAYNFKLFIKDVINKKVTVKM